MAAPRRFTRAANGEPRTNGPRGPQKMGEVISALLSRKGYAHLQSGLELTTAWEEAVGQPHCQASRAGGVKRGVLEVVVKSSIVLQELTFRKKKLVALLVKSLPEHQITDLRFRVGTW